MIGININPLYNPVIIPLMKNTLSYVIRLYATAVLVTSSAGYAADDVKPSAESDSAATQTTKSAQPPAMSDKEAAFREFYKRDPACDSFRDDNMMDRCRHAYMTAKKEFEKVWANRNQK